MKSMASLFVATWAARQHSALKSQYLLWKLPPFFVSIEPRVRVGSLNTMLAFTP